MVDYSVTFFETAYVGLQNYRKSYGEDNDYNIGFMTEHGDSAALVKKMGTVDGWRDKDLPPIITDNKPLTGFKVIGFSSRHMTDNKVARILDPRGFILEIYMDNFDDIIAENNINKGIIDAKMLWGRKNGKNVLVREDSKEYTDYLDKKKRGVVSSGETYDEGSVIVDKNGNKYIFVGKRHMGFVKYLPSIYMVVGTNHYNNPISIPHPNVVYEANIKYSASKYYYSYNKDKYYGYSDLGLSYKRAVDRNSYYGGYYYREIASAIKEGTNIELDLSYKDKKSDYFLYFSVRNDGKIDDTLIAKRTKIKSSNTIENSGLTPPFDVDSKSTYINTDLIVDVGGYLSHYCKNHVGKDPKIVSDYVSDIEFFKTKKECREFFVESEKNFEESDGFSYLNNNDFDKYMLFCQKENVSKIALKVS